MNLLPIPQFSLSQIAPCANLARKQHWIISGMSCWIKARREITRFWESGNKKLLFEMTTCQMQNNDPSCQEMVHLQKKRWNYAKERGRSISESSRKEGIAPPFPTLYSWLALFATRRERETSGRADGSNFEPRCGASFRRWKEMRKRHAVNGQIELGKDNNKVDRGGLVI